ncbi:hypothetical protein IAQ61_006243 [Plenodomus lingam]|uniref:uncharacterized protein n=1 Tax=Leptosphaeria maculans TaxID=5022 RepID=UPI0033196D4D|nr:hypothetical protein IAQ61_006243 [Plenodomus lingam]
MDVTKDAVDAAANLLGPYLQNSPTRDTNLHLDRSELVKQAIYHLKAINTANLMADVNTPYDASLAGVAYGLFDLVMLLGIIPHLSPGVAFSQRPKSVLSVTSAQFPSTGERDEMLSEVIDHLLPILEQNRTGVQPLLSQRVLPDIVTALAELSFSPTSNPKTRQKYQSDFHRVILETPTSRLLPILTTLLQQPLPPWLKPVVSNELSHLPFREKGIRHIIEFLSLSYLSKTSQIPQDALGPQSQIPIPIEAIAHASRLLVLPPTGTRQDKWLRCLAPQLLSLLDGESGKELARAAGQIIADGILSKKTTGAPGTVGWDLFVMPIFQKIYPKQIEAEFPTMHHGDEVLVQDLDLKLALKRLVAILSSSSHAGLMKRLVGPLLLPLWALLNFAKARPSLDNEWTRLSQTSLSRYLATCCEAKYVDKIALNLFWDGDTSWIFGSGSHGGVEIRRRSGEISGPSAMSSILTRIENLSTRVELLAFLLVDADIPDAIAGTIFLMVTKRWLSPAKKATASLTYETDTDLLAPLIDAKLSEMLAIKFKDKFARSPRNIIELMAQLIQNTVDRYKLKLPAGSKSLAASCAMFEHIVKQKDGDQREAHAAGGDTTDDDLVTYALGILNALMSSPGFQQSPEIIAALNTTLPSLTYLTQQHSNADISTLIRSSASTLLQLISALNSSATATTTPFIDPLSDYRATLKTVLSEITSADPPNRVWALSTLHSLIRNPIAFPVVDIPSLIHMLLSSSLADPESYVHTAAAPVILSLAIRIPTFVVKTITEAFLDIDEVSLKSGHGKEAEEKERALQESLDYRLRIGELLHTIVLSQELWQGPSSNKGTHYETLRQIFKACLVLASRRGRRHDTQTSRILISNASRRIQEETEEAWGGPVPNVLEPEGHDPKDQAELDALSNILREWEDTGLEEDVRIRTSALSVLSTVLEYRLDLLPQAMVDTSLQMVLTMLPMETSRGKAMLRRAGLLVLLGLLRGLDTALDEDRGGVADVNIMQQREIEKIIRWVKDEDGDALTRGHAASVLEGLETMRMKKLYRIRDGGLRLGPNLELEGKLRGLDVTPGGNRDTTTRGTMVEEVE